MADHLFQTTVEPTELTLTPAMAWALMAHGAHMEGGEDDNALEQVVRGDRNRHGIYVFFENGWGDIDYEEPEEFGGEAEDRPEYDRLVKLDEEALFREILLVNPKVTAIEVKSAATCSKMRPGEFGGDGLYVTRTHYLRIGDGSAEVREDGTIKITAQVHSFDEVEKEAAKP
jgi:hypothetical protein